MMSFSTPLKDRIVNNAMCKVRVVVRVREFECVAPVSCVSVIDQDIGFSGEVTVYIKDQETSRSECYNVDGYFGGEEENVSRIFESEVVPLIPGVFHGVNATVFAYGATGSGKTYTMQGTDELPGLMPLAMSKILSMCQSTGSMAEISYYEVYMDKCYDLLELKAKEIAILDDKDGNIHLRGLSRVSVRSMSEFYDVFSCGIQRRKVAHTGLNDVSSRSHGVLVVSVCTPCDDGSVVNGKINLIDLAGNEDNKRTGNEGIRLQESSKINQSLFALSNVIYALNNCLLHVPYRESKLTRILQDSLGGSSRVLMVACLNPGEYQECVHTVSLAARSRHVSNYVPVAQNQETPKVKVDMEAKLRAWLESKGKTQSLQRSQAVGTPVAQKYSTNVSSTKKLNMSCYSHTKAKAAIHKSCNTKERTISRTVRILHSQDTATNSFLESLDHAADGTKDKFPKEDGNYQDEIVCMEKMITSPGCGKRNVAQSPSRKALTPININTVPRIEEDFSSTDKKRSNPFASPFPTVTNKESHAIGTPLDKFSATLKNYFTHEYVNFLNTASRHELQEIKGIGSKIADYIVELRESSPLKSLDDLQKIGLSSKQVHNLSIRAINGVLGQGRDATPSCSEQTEPIN